MPKAYLVYNPAAGRFPSRMLTERAADVLREQGWEMCLYQTDGGPHIAQLAHQAADQGMDAFFMAGGDGSINFATRGLVGSQTALGVLPAGTANVWARELGLPGLTWTRLMALEESARRFGRAEVRLADVGYCDGMPFLLWAGVGLDAFIVHRIEPRSRWEKHFAIPHYATLALQQASVWSGMHLDAWVDGVEISGHYILGVVSNIHLYAGGFAEISPQARIDDGVMDLWLFAGETVYETLRHAWDLWSGKHVDSEKTRRLSFRCLTLSSHSPMYVQTDGEPLKEEQEVTIEVRSKAIRVLVPQGASKTLFEEDREG